jgi:hypothetical protein
MILVVFGFCLGRAAMRCVVLCCVVLLEVGELLSVPFCSVLKECTHTAINKKKVFPYAGSKAGRQAGRHGFFRAASS